MAVTLTNSYKYIGRTSCKSQNGSGSYYLILHAKTSPNTTTGIHTVSIKGILASNYGSFYGYPSTSTGKINGTQVYNNSKKPNSAWSGKNALSSTLGGGTKFNQSFTLGEDSLEVDCTNGQSKDIALQVYYKFSGDPGDTYTPNTGAKMTVNATVTLSAIERAATITEAPNFNDEQNPTFKFNNPMGANASKLEVCIATQDSEGTWRSDEVPYREVSTTATSYTFNLTTAERNALRAKTPNSNTLPVSFYVQTTLSTGSKLRSHVDKTMSITNANPTMSLAITEENPKLISLFGSNSAESVVSGASKLKVVGTPSPKKYATTKSISLTCGNTTAKDPANNTYTFNGVTGQAISYSITDSRNNTGTGSISLNTLPYIPIVIKSFEFKRKDLDHPKNVVLTVEADCYSGSIQDRENTFIVSYTTKGVTTNLNQDQFSVASNKLIINNLDLGEVIEEDAVESFTLTISDLCMEVSKSMNVILLIPTFEAGQNDFQVNGTLYVADKTGKNVLSLLDYVYPVGSFYMSSKSDDPALRYGGEWTRVDNQFLFGGKDGDDTYGPGKTGGAATVTLATTHMPKHKHGPGNLSGYYKCRESDDSGSKAHGAERITFTAFDVNSTGGAVVINGGATAEVGDGTAHENMPPFRSIYIWERTK